MATVLVWRGDRGALVGRPRGSGGSLVWRRWSSDVAA